jgi:nicotinamidase-related amidase
MVIDMQVDFCGDGGLCHQAGGDMEMLRAPIPQLRKVLDAARHAGFHIVHTRETFAPDLSDLQPHRRWRRQVGSPEVGDQGPKGRYLIEGEPCWQILPEFAPLPGEPVFDKPSYGAFATTDIDRHLRCNGIENLILTGVTTDCCIQSNLREALDRGYMCLVLEDCVGATSRERHEASLTLIRKANGVFGAISTSGELLHALGITVG